MRQTNKRFETPRRCVGRTEHLTLNSAPLQGSHPVVANSIPGAYAVGQLKGEWRQFGVLRAPFVASGLELDLGRVRVIRRADHVGNLLGFVRGCLRIFGNGHVDDLPAGRPSNATPPWGNADISTEY
jgi:hypothetical protein